MNVLPYKKNYLHSKILILYEGKVVQGPGCFVCLKVLGHPHLNLLHYDMNEMKINEWMNENSQQVLG